jgi:hypothetical protein
MIVTFKRANNGSLNQNVKQFGKVIESRQADYIQLLIAGYAFPSRTNIPFLLCVRRTYDWNQSGGADDLVRYRAYLPRR